MNSAEQIHESAWQSPSNIALVKYWGKKGQQLPANPSISFTLDKALTTTRISARQQASPGGVSLEFYFEEQLNEAFAGKVRNYLQQLTSEFEWLNRYHLTVHSSNSFPHSSGIASSASAFSALALCLCSLHEQIAGEPVPDLLSKASDLARRGSGSACRSVYGGHNLWGETLFLEGSSDAHAVNIDHLVNPVFANMQDTILIIEKGKKAVSSTSGHALLKEHPFAKLRYSLAEAHTGQLMEILKNGDVDAYIRLVEQEALMLHALMMTSPTPFILMKPNTLAVLEKIWDYRNQTGTQLLFTLDAGANVHLIHTDKEKEQVAQFVQNELVGYCQNGLYFCNAIGSGPQKLKNA